MIGNRSGPFAALLLLVLAGCATTARLAWTLADGSTNGAVAADLAECRKLARDEAWRIDWERRWPPRFYDPRFMPPHYRWPHPFWLEFPHSFEREQALVEFCMHSKGYRLERIVYE